MTKRALVLGWYDFILLVVDTSTSALVDSGNTSNGLLWGGLYNATGFILQVVPGGIDM